MIVGHNAGSPSKFGAPRVIARESEKDKPDSYRLKNSKKDVMLPVPLNIEYTEVHN